MIDEPTLYWQENLITSAIEARELCFDRKLVNLNLSRAKL